MRLSCSNFDIELCFSAIRQRLGRYIALFMLTLFALLLSAPARAEWREARTEHFIIYSQGGNIELNEASRQLEATHWLLSILTNADTQRMENEGLPIIPVRIYFVRDINEVRRILHARNSDIAGVYRSQLEGPIILAPRNEGQFSLTAMRHEYAHHFMMQYMNGIYPRWFSEGFAEVIGSSNLDRQGRVAFGSPPDFRAWEVRGETWTPLSHMFARPSADNPSAGDGNYGQFWVATHFMLTQPGRTEQLFRYFAALNRGESDTTAYAAFGQTIAELDRELRAYRQRNRYLVRQTPVPIEALAAPTIRILTDAEAAIIPFELETANDPSDEDRTALLRAVGTLAARFPNDPGIARLNSRLLLADEQWPAAIAAADQTLALAPNDPRALSYKGLAMVQMAAEAGPVDLATFRRARLSIIQANRQAPDDPVPLFANYLSFVIAQQTPNSVAVDGLSKSLRLVPQEHGLRIMLGMALINQRDITGARALLMPLAYAPHVSGAQAFALRLVTWIDAGAEGTPPIPTRPDAVAAT